MNARGRQKPTPPTGPAGRGRSGGATCLCPAHSCLCYQRSLRLQTPPPAPQARRRLRVPRLQAGVSPRTANYDIDVTLDPPTRTLTGSELITWHNPGAIAAYSIRLHLYWNAFRNTNSTWLKQRHLAGDDPFCDRGPGRFRLHQRHQAHHRQRRRQRRRRPDEGPALHLARRSEHGRSIAGRGGSGRRGSAGTDAAAARDLDRQVSAQLRSHRRDRQLLLRLAVVPEARRVRPGMDGAPVLRQLRVLLRLRQLRRAHDGADGLDRRRDGRRAIAHRQRRQHDASLRAGRRARLRVDDEPGLHREAAAVRHAGPRAGADAAADPAGARVPRRSPFRRRGRGAEVLRRVVRRVSVSDD